MTFRVIEEVMGSPTMCLARQVNTAPSSSFWAEYFRVEVVVDKSVPRSTFTSFVMKIPAHKEISTGVVFKVKVLER